MGRWTISLLTALVAAHAVAQAPVEDTVIGAADAEARGFDYLFGRGVSRDPAQAASWLEQAATAGRPRAAAVLAEMYQFGQGVPRDATRARELAAQAAPLGVASAQRMVGEGYVVNRDTSTRDPAAGLMWLNAAAEQEDSMALYLLGQMYRYGDGVDANAELAVRLLTRAAELGLAPAGVEAGMYLLNRGVDAGDVQRGLFFLRAAATSSYPPAVYLLAKLYLTGRHLERDPGLAVQWLTRASSLEFGLASLWLAELYAKGVGVTADAGRVTELRDHALPTMTTSERNAFAWELAVSPMAELRNGVFAVEVMETVTTESPTSAYLDTLAAAYAEVGRFDDAVRAQLMAIDALPNEASARAKASFGERAALYRAREPYREEP